MKRILLFCSLFALVGMAHGQGFTRSRTVAEGDYTRPNGFEPSVVIATDYRTTKDHGLSFGIKLGHEKYAFNAAYQIALAGKRNEGGLFFVENRYLYRRFMGFGLQEFNGMLSFGYSNIHWDFKLGLCNRYIAEVPLRINGGMGTILEPMNVVFGIHYRLLPEDHSWNVGAGISNQREFIIERVTLFYYSIDGYYAFGDKWRIIGEAGLHPSGVLNLSAQYNGFFVNFGLTYQY